jgi:hypothetical protein
MATQNEVIQYLKTNYSQLTQDGELYGLRFDAGDGRTQNVVIQVTEKFLLAASAFATTDQITDSQAIGVSSIATPVCKVGNFFMVSNAMMIQDIDPSEIHFVVELTTLRADDLEKSLGLGDHM